MVNTKTQVKDDKALSWLLSIRRNKSLTDQKIWLYTNKDTCQMFQVIYESRNGILVIPMSNSSGQDAVFYPWNSISSIEIDPLEN